MLQQPASSTYRMAVWNQVADSTAAGLWEDARQLPDEVEARHAYVRQQRPPVELQPRKQI
jgi:hypothetical protein